MGESRQRRLIAAVPARGKARDPRGVAAQAGTKGTGPREEGSRLPSQEHHGRMAKARAGKPRPSLTLGQATTISAPVAGTWSRLAMTSI